LKGFRLVWCVIASTIVAYLVVGTLFWENLRATVAPPGFAAGVGFPTTVFWIGLVILLLIARIKYRRTWLANALSLWIAAEAFGLLSLALYALPGFPFWGFLTLIGCSFGLLAATHPWKKETMESASLGTNQKK
jgi:hypothetical protein